MGRREEGKKGSREAGKQGSREAGKQESRKEGKKERRKEGKKERRKEGKKGSRKGTLDAETGCNTCPAYMGAEKCLLRAAARALVSAIPGILVVFRV